MITELPYDVFLSHNQADKPRVRLRAAGLRQIAVRTSDLGLRISAAGGRVGLERNTVGRGNLPFRDPANAGRRFIPLLLADGEASRPTKTACRISTARNATNSAYVC